MRGKWDFLKILDANQKLKLANALRNHPNITGQKHGDKIYRYVTKSEEENANRWISEWLSHGNDGTLLLLAGQPYNIAFWQPEFLKPLGIEPSPRPKVIKITFSGRFVDLKNHVGDWPVIADNIRRKLDGGFVGGGIVSNPELVIWRKECIKNVEEEEY